MGKIFVSEYFKKNFTVIFVVYATCTLVTILSSHNPKENFFQVFFSSIFYLSLYTIFTCIKGD